MNINRGHESNLHREAKKRIGAIFQGPDWTLFFEQKNADLVLLHHSSGSIIAIEVESSPRNVLRNIRRNFDQGCCAVATISLNPRMDSQIQNKIHTHLPETQTRRIRFFEYSEDALRSMRFWILHICQTTSFSPQMRTNQNINQRISMKRKTTEDNRLINRIELPQGSLAVDPAALQKARQGVPKGDMHIG